MGQQVPFVTGSYTNTGAANGGQIHFRRFSVRMWVTLQVTPQINEGDSVVMDIVQEVSSISQQALSASDVITNERKIETKVLAKDGDIVVLGGLVKTIFKIRSGCHSFPVFQSWGDFSEMMWSRSPSRTF